MITATRTLAHTETLHKPSVISTTPKPGVGVLLLIIIVLLSGLAVIYLADINRRLAIALENSMNTQNQLHQQWGKLLLEESTWSTQARVQTIAVNELGMQSPKGRQMVIIK